MSNVEQHVATLGFRAKDKVTGFEGVITTIAFDLYGCIQAAITPGLDKDGAPANSHWFDVNRLQLAEGGRVMPSPDFAQGYVAEGNKGPAEKPPFNRTR